MFFTKPAIAVYTALLALLSHPVDAAEVSIEIGAGGLAFAHNAAIKIDKQDVVVTTDKITVTYALRNSSETQQSLYVSFALPDLDANAISEDRNGLAAVNTQNFVQSATNIDGQPTAVRFEQRAYALGLDATAALIDADLPLFPLDDGLTLKLERITPLQRTELVERGILKEEGEAVLPAWTLKTVAYWRQTFAKAQTTTIVHSYRPLAGITDYSGDALPSFRKRMCLTTAQENAAAKLRPDAGLATQLKGISYLATQGADALGAVASFRLIIETADSDTIIASCRDGLKRTGPMQLEWSSADYLPEEDFQFLFIR